MEEENPVSHCSGLSHSFSLGGRELKTTKGTGAGCVLHRWNGALLHPYRSEASSPAPEWLLATGKAEAPPKRECPERSGQIKAVA